MAIAAPEPNRLLWRRARDGPDSPLRALLRRRLGRAATELRCRCSAAARRGARRRRAARRARRRTGAALPRPRLPARDRHRVGDVPTLLAAQHYRLAWWREPTTAQLPPLLRRRHADRRARRGPRGLRRDPRGVLDCRQGVVDGLRIDHPDGLADPQAYLERLRDATGGAWVVVEKILAPGEPLPAAWPCAGTTGYDALAAIQAAYGAPRSGRSGRGAGRPRAASRRWERVEIRGQEPVLCAVLFEPEVQRLRARGSGGRPPAPSTAMWSPRDMEALRELLSACPGLSRLPCDLAIAAAPDRGSRVWAQMDRAGEAHATLISAADPRHFLERLLG